LEQLTGLYYGFSIALTWQNLTYCFLGTLVGTLVGVLPGLGPAATVALLLPITFKLPPVSAIIMLAGIFYGAMYGGSTTSILLNIPGEAASVVTCIDGYQMALQGRAGPALAIAAIGSFIAGTIGIVGLNFLAPPLAEFAVQFGPPEYFALTLFGLFLAAYLASSSMVKGLIMVVLGLMLDEIGIDPIMGIARFSYGVLPLQEGLDFVPLAMGLFGIAEILINTERAMKTQLVTQSIGRLFITLRDWAEAKWATLRGSVLGFFVGILPGGGAVIASLISYAVEKRVSRNPEKFGKGAIEGVAGPEAANNSAATGSFIPLLTLGIPGNATIAMIFAALLIHGVQPGPYLIKENPEIFWGVIASMYIGNGFLLILNLPLVGMWVQVLRVPYFVLAPFILLLCIVGVYSTRNNIFDIWVMILFGVVGYFFRKLEFEPGPLILAFVLGAISERTFRQSLLMSKGSPLIFFGRPISCALMVMLLALVALQVFFIVKRRTRSLDQFRGAG
jgi:putative tricarboxylic transport membrane protein